MSAPIDILNAKVPGYKNLQMIVADPDGSIQAIYPMEKVFKRVAPPNVQIIDVGGNWVSLGGVDLQINGALGLAFPDLESQHLPLLEKICRFLWTLGIDGFLPTLVTTSVEKIQRSLSTLAEFIAIQKNPAVSFPKQAEILGVHLEGPFLNPEKRGAHPAEFLLPLTIDQVKRVLGPYENIVKIVTLAPELDDTGAVIPFLRSLGITVSLGHSQATAEQAQRAFSQGASMVTHAFNAMPSLHHREPGMLGAALINSDVHCGLIADGQHVSPMMIEVLLRASQYEKGIFLVSDALAPLGLPDGLYPWDSRKIEVKNNTAWVRVDYHTPIECSTLAGTTLPLLMGVKNLVKWEICSLESAISLATDAPRKAIGLPGLIGQSSSQLLRWYVDELTQELAWKRLL